LANALDDDDNHELQAIFLDAHDNEKYVRLKKHREFLKSIAHKIQSEAKETPSSFTPPKNSQDSDHGSLLDIYSSSQ
jgi:asparagine synthetase A